MYYGHDTSKSVSAYLHLLTCGAKHCYQSRCRWRFRLKTLRTSWVKRSASNTGKRFSSAVSIGSLNHDLMGIALSNNKEGDFVLTQVCRNFIHTSISTSWTFNYQVL